jgi:hypothetical protein
VLKINKISNHKPAWMKLVFISNEWRHPEMTIFHMISSIWHSAKGIAIDTVKEQGSLRIIGKEKWVERTQRLPKEVKLLWTVLKWWVHVITNLSKCIKCTPRVIPKVNNGLWVTMMYQYQIIDHVLLWWRILVTGKVCIYVWESLWIFYSILLWP